MLYKSKIAGTGSAFPARIVTNHDLSRMVETSDEWIVERTGIRERHVADGTPQEITSVFAAKACQNALAAAASEAQSRGDVLPPVDLIIVATVTPDHVMPNTASTVQSLLSLQRAAAFDLSAACTGFVYGLTIADGLIKSGIFKSILVTGSETLSSIIDWNDRNTCILFGDGAGAALVTRASTNEHSEIISHRLYAEGQYGDYLNVPSSGCALPISPAILEQKLNKVRMKGKEIFKVAVRMLADTLVESLEAADMKVSDLDWLIPHQANLRILEAVAKRLNFPMEKIIINLDRCGNTSGATVPTALDEAVRSGKIQRGQLVGLTAFGAGLTYGSTILRY